MAQAAPAASVGINLEGVSDWEAQHLFVDLMKSARYWYTTWPAKAPVDEAGWPTGDANLVLATAPGKLGRTEPYRLTFTGRAVLAALGGLTVSKVAYDAATNTTRADVVIKPGEDVNLGFRETRRRPGDKSATGVTDVRLMTPGHQPGEVFTHDLLARIAHFSTLRFMQALGAAGTGSPANPDVNWSDRQRPGWPQQSGESGIAWEYVAMLGNQAGKDVWINLPLGASDEYVTKVAQLFRYGSDGIEPHTAAQANPRYPPLAPNLRIYVEYVNELWNGYYKSTASNVALAAAEQGAGNPHHYTGPGLQAGLERQARRTVEISEIFRRVFGDAAMMTRVRPVLCSQWGNWGTFDYPLDYIQARYGSPHRYLYGIAGAPYVTVENENQDGLTTAQVLDQMSASLHRRGGMLDQITTFRALADRHDRQLRILAYEGGAGNLAGHSDAAKAAAQDDPRMGAIVRELLAKWYSVSADPFAYYTLCAGYGFGYFALSTDITSEAGPKWQAVKEIAGLK